MHRATGRKNPSNYIVMLKDEADKTAHLEWLRGRLVGESKITNDYTIIKAYSGTFDDETLTEIRRNKDVKRIEEVSWKGGFHGIWIRLRPSMTRMLYLSSTKSMMIDMTYFELELQTPAV